MNSNKLTINSLLFLLLISLMLILIPSATTAQQYPASADSGPESVLIDFLDPASCTFENTKFVGTGVELGESSLYLDQSDFNNGISTDCIAERPGGLRLVPTGEGSAIDVKTNRTMSFPVDEENWGYQTFQVDVPLSITSVKFVASLFDRGANDGLVVYIEDEEKNELDSIYLPSELFSNTSKEIYANLSADLEAGKTYNLLFHTFGNDGGYFIIGDENSVYGNGGFYTYDIEVCGCRGGDDEVNDIEFEIFAKSYSNPGSYVSAIQLENSATDWKSILWAGSPSKNLGEVRLKVRSGDSSDPSDGSFSEWEEITNLAPGVQNDLELPAGKAIQYKIELSPTKNGFSPVVQWIQIYIDKIPTQGKVTTNNIWMPSNGTWSNFSAASDLDGNKITYYCSIDSGSSWDLIITVRINDNDVSSEFLRESQKIMFKAELKSDDPLKSPSLFNMTIDYLELPDNTGDGSVCVIDNNSITDDDDDVVDGNATTNPPITDDQKNSNEPSFSLERGVIVILVLFALLIIGLTGYIVGTESGKYAFANNLNKIKKKDQTNPKVRKRILKYIRRNPGANYSKILTKMGGSNGMVAHHLEALERERLIRSRADGVRYHRFYPGNTAQNPKQEIDEP